MSDQPESYARATQRTAADLLTIAARPQIAELSRLSLPEIEQLTEVLLTLANYVQRWEERTIEQRKLRAIKTLAIASPVGVTCLVGIDSLLSQLTHVLTSPDGAKLTMLSGLGGVGKTTVARAAVEQLLQADQFHALAWINCQADRFSGTPIHMSQAQAVTRDAFFDHVLRQLRPNPVSDRVLFDQIAVQVGSEKVSFDQLLGFLHQELDSHEPSHLSLAEKRSLVTDLLWAAPTLIVIDGLEATADPQKLIEELWHLASRTNLKVLITSRSRLSDHHDAKLLDMRGLAASDAIHLLRTYASERGIEAVDKASPDDLYRLAVASGGNPLVIQWIVNQLSVLPVQQVSNVLSRAGAEVFEFIYQNTWEALSMSARKVLIAIAWSASAENGWETLQHSTGLRPDILNRSLQELVAGSLVVVSAGSDPAYQIAPMTRAFVLNTVDVEANHQPTIGSFETYRPPMSNDLASRIVHEDTYRRWAREYRE